MDKLGKYFRFFGRYLFEISAIFAVIYVLAILTFVLIEFETKLNIADRIVYYLKFIPWGDK